MLDTSILLVEDNRDCEALAVRLLNRAGFTTVSVARDGVEALDALLGEATRENAPDLVLLDMRLPKLDGIDVLKRLRADERTRGLRVVALSASEDPREVDACRELGVLAILPKPLDANFLKSLLPQAPRTQVRTAAPATA